MRVYVVRAHADVEYEHRDSWTCGVFASDVAAKRYVDEQSEKFREDSRRISELDYFATIRALTDEEVEDWRERNNYWYWNRRLPNYCIEEYELQGVES